jgi:hypothetical protein
MQVDGAESDNVIIENIQIWMSGLGSVDARGPRTDQIDDDDRLLTAVLVVAPAHCPFSAQSSIGVCTFPRT